MRVLLCFNAPPTLVRVKNVHGDDAIWLIGYINDYASGWFILLQ